ncbi:phosphatase PAP2 family protein [Streptomyces sp. WMMC500]|uniref:bifunctional phosphatase PAP2/diacylglycerol kinase family protein n=1 Tax=Streptomyces sp. WMMC500 TaxID=3015154 RepID=UPI00248C3267|nr:phosphatase PAP2 family protein [Streptomyces sp. WMMC500]WBB64575.1 phosphatase PAP2 family protein [Streptomyces sp. WMMC500]
MGRRLRRADHVLFARVAATRWPGAEPVLPRLSRGADHGLLWFGAAATIAALGGSRGRRAALRGVGSLALASATVNTAGKGAFRRARPVLDAVPVIRHLARQPITSSFPSGHSASAAAFVCGVAFESPRWAAVLAPVAWSVAFSRVYTGVHYPSDVLAGSALGLGAALVVRRLVPPRPRPPHPAPPPAAAPALPDGTGLYVVINPASGVQPQLLDPVRQLAAVLPEADVAVVGDDNGPLPDLLDTAAKEAARHGGALGVCGGDGSVAAAAVAAMRYGVPLAVLPGGTFNHFATDLGVESIPEACRAVARGSAVAVDVGRLLPRAPGDGPVYFLNTLSLGIYPELVRWRERFSPMLGGPLGSVAATLRVIRTAEPVGARINGRWRNLWLLFAGSGAYHSVGVAPVRRDNLADGVLDVRTAHAGRLGRARLLATALAGGLARTRLYAAGRLRRVAVAGLPEGTRMAYDGEVVAAPTAFVLDKLERALTVYRPAKD